jgi:hypothetical protein
MSVLIFLTVAIPSPMSIPNRFHLNKPYTNEFISKIYNPTSTVNFSTTIQNNSSIIIGIFTDHY